MLQGILNLTSSYQSENEDLGSVNSSMSLLMVRLLAGKLSEGWQFLQDSYFRKPTIAITVEPKLQKDSEEALKKLKQYFSRDNQIHKIRNHFAFHYSNQNAAKVVEELGNREYWEVVMKDGQIPVFVTAEEIVSKVMYDEVDSDPDKAMENLIKEVFDITQSFKLFCDGCLANMVDTSVSHDLYAEEVNEIEK